MVLEFMSAHSQRASQSVRKCFAKTLIVQHARDCHIEQTSLLNSGLASVSVRSYCVYDIVRRA
jgi:hypothetical protein